MSKRIKDPYAIKKPRRIKQTFEVEIIHKAAINSDYVKTFEIRNAILNERCDLARGILKVRRVKDEFI